MKCMEKWAETASEGQEGMRPPPTTTRVRETRRDRNTPRLKVSGVSLDLPLLFDGVHAGSDITDQW